MMIVKTVQHCAPDGRHDGWVPRGGQGMTHAMVDQQSMCNGLIPAASIAGAWPGAAFPQGGMVYAAPPGGYVAVPWLASGYPQACGYPGGVAAGFPVAYDPSLLAGAQPSNGSVVAGGYVVPGAAVYGGGLDPCAAGSPGLPGVIQGVVPPGIAGYFAVPAAGFPQGAMPGNGVQYACVPAMQNGMAQCGMTQNGASHEGMPPLPDRLLEHGLEGNGAQIDVNGDE